MVAAFVVRVFVKSAIEQRIAVEPVGFVDTPPG